MDIPTTCLVNYFKSGRDRMALTTTYMGVETPSSGLFAVGGHPDSLLEKRHQRAGHFGAQAHRFAGIRPGDGRDRTVGT
jgi:hypothetical protein